MLTEKGREFARKRIQESYHEEFRDVLANAFRENPDLKTTDIQSIIEKDLDEKTNLLYKHYKHELFGRILHSVFRAIDFQTLAEELLKEKESFFL